MYQQFSRLSTKSIWRNQWRHSFQSRTLRALYYLWIESYICSLRVPETSCNKTLNRESAYEHKSFSVIMKANAIYKKARSLVVEANT